jgi:hypothetical protein
MIYALILGNAANNVSSYKNVVCAPAVLVCIHQKWTWRETDFLSQKSGTVFTR